MRFKNLFSLKHLLAMGFLLVMVPLLLAVTYAAFAIEETAGLSEKAIYQVVEQTKVTRLVLQKVADIERKAKLFVLLADPSLRSPYERESYENARAQLKQALGELLKVEGDNKIALLANELSEKERLIYEQIVGSGTGEDVRLPVDDAFRGLHEAATALWEEVSGRVDRKVEELHEHVKSVRQRLLLRGVVLVLVSVAFVLGLWLLLRGAIRQMDESIRRLGAGDFVEPIQVTGPRDLRYLGDRLEWLRSRLLSLEESKQRFMHNFSDEFKAPLENLSDTAAACWSPWSCSRVAPNSNTRAGAGRPSRAPGIITRGRISTNC
jgi:two-component system sensor histidine kinase GlrK